MELFTVQRDIQKLKDENLAYIKRIRTSNLSSDEIKQFEALIYENNCKIRDLETKIEVN